MNKRLALASAAVGSTVIFAGILGMRTIEAGEIQDKSAFHDRLLTRMQEFWGEDFDKRTFEQRFQIFTAEREQKRQNRILEFNSSELSDYLELNFDEVKDLHRNGITLLEYAEDKDLDPEIIAELIEAEMLDHLTEALESGQISQEEYNDKADNIDHAVADRLNGEKAGKKAFR